MKGKFLITIGNFPVAAFLFAVTFAATVLSVNAQADGDKDVAVIIDEKGIRRTIKYSELLFQLALEPNTALKPLKTEDLKRVLRTLINLGIIAGELETSRIPCEIATDAEVKDEIRKHWSYFSSRVEFEKRLQIIGFVSINDDDFYRQMAARTRVRKWIDFRFRTFLIILREEEEKYYRDVFSPDFRRKQPGLILPDLQQVRQQIRQILIEQKVEGEINRFLEYARQQVKIEILSDELK